MTSARDGVLFSIVTPVYNPRRRPARHRRLRARRRPSRLGADPGRRLLDRRRRSAPCCASCAAADSRIRVIEREDQRPHRRRLQRRRRGGDGRVHRPARPRRPAGRRGAGADRAAIERAPRRRLPVLRRGQGRRRRATSTTRSASRRGPPSGCAARCTPATCRCCAPRWCARWAASTRATTAPRTTTSCCGSPSRRARSCTSPRCSTTGAASRARPPATSTPSPTPRSPAASAVQDHLDRLGIAGEVGHGPVAGPLPHLAPPRPGPPGLDRDPHERVVGPGLGRAAGVRRRGRPLPAASTPSTTTSRSWSSTTSRRPRRVLDELRELARRPAGARAVRRDVQLQPQDEPRGAALHRRPDRAAQRRR